MKKKLIIKIIFILFLLIILIFVLSIINFFLNTNTIRQTKYINNISIIDNTNLNTSHDENDSEYVILENNPTTIQDDISISMCVIGDIMCHNTQFKDAYSNGTYDFSYVFSDIKDYINNADISIGNLETTFAGNSREYDGYPSFNTPEALAYDLNELGIDVVTTANNHSLDTGYSRFRKYYKFLK